MNRIQKERAKNWLLGLIIIALWSIASSMDYQDALEASHHHSSR